VSGSFSLNGPTNIKAFYNEFKWKDARLWHDFILLPGDGATDGTALSFAYAFNVSADDAFRLEGTNSYSLQIGSVKPPSRKDLRPAFTQPLEGENLVRVRNPNDFAVAVGIRSGEKGKDFEVPAKGVNTVYVPNGRYDIYFVYSDKPDALFQGDSFTLVGKGVEIQIVKVVNGNYGIRQVK
jgi:hypothetical protein